MKRVLATAAVLAVGLVSRASAATITQVTNLGTVYTTDSVAPVTSGADMGGMLVTAVVVGPGGASTTVSGTWQSVALGLGFINFDSSFGGELGDDFTLAVWGQTFADGIWMMDFRLSGGIYSLASLEFDGSPGDTVFDVANGGSVGTAGSSFGRDFGGFATWNGTVQATYFNAVALGANAPVGDLYTNLLLEFLDSGLPEASMLLGAGAYTFTLDSDNAVTTAVPEPASMLLLGTGLLGLASRLRRRKV